MVLVTDNFISETNMRISPIFILFLLFSCSEPEKYNFHVLEISDKIDIDYLLENSFFQSEEYYVAFDKQVKDTLIVIELEDIGQKFEPYVISWTFPITSNLTDAKNELKRLGLIKILELQKNVECESCEPESITFIGQTEQKDTYRIFWGPNLDTDAFPDGFGKDYKLRIEYSFNPTFDEIYGVN